ncbi:hypothetical protein M1D93_14065 [Arthrobacter sp. Z1-9]
MIMEFLGGIFPVRLGVAKEDVPQVGLAFVELPNSVAGRFELTSLVSGVVDNRS